CITLLTGKQPMELYDPYSNAWSWRTYVQVSDLLEAVLNRMLLPAASERFQSAEEVTAALKHRPSFANSGQQAASPSPSAAKNTSIQPPPPPPPPAVAQTPPPPSPAVAQSPTPLAKPVARPIVAPPAPPRFLDDPLAIISGAFFLGFEMSLLAIAFVSFIGMPLMSVGILAAIAIGLAIFIIRRIIEKADLIILMVVSIIGALLIEGFGNFSMLQAIDASPFILLLFLPVMGGLIFLAASILFLLIYRLLDQLL
ncbi:MAG: hypothetical protein AAF327_08810, partial [Cyanobacteria bacterium P01_A01_bin.37]